MTFIEFVNSFPVFILLTIIAFTLIFYLPVRQPRSRKSKGNSAIKKAR